MVGKPGAVPVCPEPRSGAHTRHTPLFFAVWTRSGWVSGRKAWSAHGHLTGGHRVPSPAQMWGHLKRPLENGWLLFTGCPGGGAFRPAVGLLVGWAASRVHRPGGWRRDCRWALGRGHSPVPPEEPVGFEWSSGRGRRMGREPGGWRLGRRGVMSPFRGKKARGARRRGVLWWLPRASLL